MAPSGTVTETRIEPLRFRIPSRRGGLCECVLYGGAAEQIRWLWQAPAFVADAGSALEEALEGVADGRNRLIRSIASADAAARVLESSGLIRDLWQVDGGLGPYPLLEILARNEYDKAYFRGYREHLVHQLRVWVLGLYLLSRMPRLLDAVVGEVRVEERFAEADELEVRAEALRRFKAAALWHDIGYVFEIQDAKDEAARIGLVLAAVNEVCARPLSSMLGDSALQAKEEMRWLREAGRARRFVTPWVQVSCYRDVVEEPGGPLWECLAPAGWDSGLAGRSEASGGLSQYLELCWKGLFSETGRDRGAFVDHGIAGALLLLRLHEHIRRYAGDIDAYLGSSPGLADDQVRVTVERAARRLEGSEPTVVAAARAIALHNIYPDLPRRSEAGARLTLGCYRLRLEEDTSGKPLPLAFLLALADGLQGWDRPGFVAPERHGDLGLGAQEVELSASVTSVYVRYVVNEPEASRRWSEVHEGLSHFMAGISDLLQPGLAEPLAAQLPREHEHKAAPSPEEWNLEPYLDAIIRECGTIELRGIALPGDTRAVSSRPIEELYAPLQAEGSARDLWALLAASGEPLDRLSGLRATPRNAAAADHPRALVLVGEPGSGKSTFLRLTATVLAKALKGEEDALQHEAVAALRTEGGEIPVPVFLRLSELVRFACREDQPDAGLDPDPGLLSRFVAHWAESRRTDIPADAIERWLRQGKAVLLMDGLDEVPSQDLRESLWRILRDALAERIYGACRFWLTSRPLPEGSSHGLVHERRLAGLSDAAIQRFLLSWSRVVAADDSGASPEEHVADLLDQVRAASVAIRALLRNPLMLTCLAVVHWNQRRLPEQRAELLDAIVSWLLRQRSGDVHGAPGLPASIRRRIFQTLALAMHTRPGGRVRELGLPEAARAIADHFDRPTEQARGDAARAFLEWEVVGSGLISPREEGLQFWHLSFQELLVADWLKDCPDDEWSKTLDRERLADPGWREVVLLLGGLLGNSKRTQSLLRLLLRPVKDGSLADKARAYGLARAVVCDLEPLRFVPDPDLGLDELEHEVMRIFEPEGLEVPLKVRVEAADALGQAGDPRLDEEQWVEIAKGLWIGRYPVTVQEFARFVDEGGYDPAGFGAEWRDAWGEGLEALLADGDYDFLHDRVREDLSRRAPGGWAEQLLTPNRPVVGISWVEADAFCRWITARADSAWSFGIPTENDWVRAAFGLGRQRRYPWGDEEPGKGEEARANYDEAGVGHPTPVGLFPSGAADWHDAGCIHDIAGNVWEWCDTRIDKDGQESDTGGWRPLRGGCFWRDAESLVVSARYGNRAALRYGDFGFRVVRWCGSSRPRSTS